jgi:hypothetical protein
MIGQRMIPWSRGNFVLLAVAALMPMVLLNKAARADNGLTVELYQDSAAPSVSYIDTLTDMNNYFGSITPTVTTNSTTGGKTSLDFSNDGYNASPSPFGASSPDSTSANYGFGGTQNYEVMFAGYINVPQAGIATFATTSDDGSTLFINDQDTPVVNNDFFQGATQRSGNYNFPTAGLYPIAIGYFQGGGGEGLLVQWTPPGGSSHTILNSELSTTSVPEPASAGLLSMSVLGLLARRRRGKGVSAEAGL